MPELGEVEHVACSLRRHILDKTVTEISNSDDNLLYVAPLSHSKFAEVVKESKVTAVGRQGKYFWIELNNEKCVVMHLGMTGWIDIKGVESRVVFMEGRKPAGKDWPPRFTKFSMKCGDVELAFSDPRRLGRVRVIDCPETELSQFEPISKLGSDFSQTEIDQGVLVPKVLGRKVPVKSLLLDQAVFSGIGNWMADEILFQARIHPEQTACSLDEESAIRLCDKVSEVCKTAAELEGDSSKFPKSWLMLHRWGKGRKKQLTSDGYEVDFTTVGGRTSCFVPELQKLTSNKVGKPKKEVKDEVTDVVEEEPTRKRQLGKNKSGVKKRK